MTLSCIGRCTKVNKISQSPAFKGLIVIVPVLNLFHLRMEFVRCWQE